MVDTAQKRSDIQLSSIIPDNYAGKRLDQTLASLFPEYSRENLKQWILNGSCLVNNQQFMPKYKLKGGENISIAVDLEEKNQTWQPENLELDIVYEDQDLLIINKPYNLVVHPAAGNWEGTLLNGLLNYHTELKFLPRAGIVHRLDKDTSGLMIIAKTLPAHNNLVAQLKQKEIVKIYEAIVHGHIIAGGTIDLPIGRHKSNRLKMAVSDEESSKPAVTHYRVIKKFNNYTHIRLEIETGRTHQIRVHMQHINHPIFADKLYAPSRLANNLISNFPRQALHAKELKFHHPVNGKELHLICELPEDLQYVLELLNKQHSI